MPSNPAFYSTPRMEGEGIGPHPLPPTHDTRYTGKGRVMRARPDDTGHSKDEVEEEVRVSYNEGSCPAPPARRGG